MPEKRYVMPKAEIGFAVWYPDRQSFDEHRPIPAMVTDPGSTSVSLTVWAPDNRGGLPKDGVRHISDPEVAKMAGYSAGLWDYTPSDKLLLSMIADLESMRLTLANLVDAIGGDPSSAG